MIHSDPASVVRDPARVAAVRATGLLDTAPEENSDRLTRLAVRLLDVPVALLSIVDEYRDFYKSHCGAGEPLATTRQIERLRAAGAQDYLTKPLDVDRFLEIVDTLLLEATPTLT